MIEFNTAILVSWILDGYEGLRIYNYKRYHKVEPIIENDFDDGCLIDYDLMAIADPRAFDISNGISSDGLSYYVDSRFLSDRKSLSTKDDYGSNQQTE